VISPRRASDTSPGTSDPSASSAPKYFACGSATTGTVVGAGVLIVGAAEIDKAQAFAALD